MFSAQRSLQYWSHPMCVCVCLLCRALSLILFLFTFLEFCLFNFLRFVKVSLWSPIIFFVCLCVCSNVCAAWVEAVGESFYKIDWLRLGVLNQSDTTKGNTAVWTRGLSCHSFSKQVSVALSLKLMIIAPNIEKCSRQCVSCWTH